MRRLTGVTKRYRRTRSAVLAGVDLVVDPGDVVALVGGNGSGKSTLARIVAGLTRPSDGTVTGRPTVGYLPDRFPGGQRLSAADYLAHMGRIGGLSTATARSRGDELLERLALAGDPHAPLARLSKGNAQKVGLAQALLTRPELVVLDEPFSGLDPNAHDVLGGILTELRADGTAVVFTEHRTDLAVAHAARPLLLTGGRLGPLDGADVRVVLRPAGAEQAAAPVRDGIVHAAHVGERVELAVRPDRCDAVLRDALADGWSVVEVRR